MYKEISRFVYQAISAAVGVAEQIFAKSAARDCQSHKGGREWPHYAE
jgi:hypothetical protein